MRTDDKQIEKYLKENLKIYATEDREWNGEGYSTKVAISLFLKDEEITGTEIWIS